MKQAMMQSIFLFLLNKFVLASQFIEDQNRKNVDYLLSKMNKYIDVVVPRGGKGLVKKVQRKSKVPVIVDAGIGTASDATIAMEMGCDGVLINSAIANAKNPIKMAKAFKNAVISGRDSYLAGRMKKNYFATASSPTEGLI